MSADDDLGAQWADKDEMPTSAVFHGVELNPGRVPLSCQVTRPWGARTIQPHQLAERVIATQPGLDVHGVRHYLGNRSNNNDRYQPAYDDDPAEWSVLDRSPNLIRMGGADYVIHGHHRVAAALLRGDTHIEARVWDKDTHPVDNRLARGRFRP